MINDNGVLRKFHEEGYGVPTGYVPDIRDIVNSNDIKTVPDKKTHLEHSHYYKDVSSFKYVDVYRVLSLFNVVDPCLQHAAKKLLVAGGRGAGKDIERDIKEVIDSCNRYLEMRKEDKNV